MNIQDDWKELDDTLKLLLLNPSINESVTDSWKKLTKWLKEKNFFGKWGYDFQNHAFLKEPEDPAQQMLF